MAEAPSAPEPSAPEPEAPVAEAIPVAAVIGSAALTQRARREREALETRRAFEDALAVLCMSLALWAVAAEMGATVFAGAVGTIIRIEVAERAAIIREASLPLPLLPPWLWLGHLFVSALFSTLTIAFASPTLRDARAAPLMALSMVYHCLVSVSLCCRDALLEPPAASALACSKLVDMARAFCLIAAIGRCVLVAGIAMAGAGAVHAHSPALIIAHLPPIALLSMLFFLMSVVLCLPLGGAVAKIVARLEAALVPEVVYGFASPRRALTPLTIDRWSRPRHLLGETVVMDAKLVTLGACTCAGAAIVAAVSIHFADCAERRARRAEAAHRTQD